MKEEKCRHTRRHLDDVAIADGWRAKAHVAIAIPSFLGGRSFSVTLVEYSQDSGPLHREAKCLAESIATGGSGEEDREDMRR